MTISRILTAAAGVCLVAFSTSPLHAHGIWFAQRAREVALIYGEGADDLDAVKRLPKLTSVTGYTADGTPVETRLEPAGIIPIIKSEKPVTIVAAVMDYGLWSRTADGKWHNKGRDQVPDAKLAEHNWKYAVYLNGTPSTPVPLLSGHTLQLVPVGRIPEKMGDALQVRAFFQGQPVPDATILTDYVNDPDQKGLKTGADGTATISVRNQGLNVLMAVYHGPADDKTKVDHMEHRASLAFVLPHEAE